MSTFDLREPIGLRMRPLPVAQVTDTLATAAAHMTGGGVVICDGDRYVGRFTQTRLRELVSGGYSMLHPVGAFAEPTVTATPYMTGAELMRLLDSTGADEAVVVDRHGEYRGVVSLADVVSLRLPPRPPVVGGMATPLGVYLTNGVIGAGVPAVGLILTGILLTSILQLGATAGYLLAPKVDAPWTNWVLNGLPILTLVLGMRLLPLSGTHGAEHMVVHAIERGEPLVRDVVRRMPRVHPRCGTNLAVGMSMFLGIFLYPWTHDQEIRLLVAVLATLFFARSVGALVQQYVTTKNPTDRQLDGAIRSAEALLRRYATEPGQRANPLRRLLASGMPYVLLGGFVVAGLLYLVQIATGIDLGITVS